jgi:hypothetical protein
VRIERERGREERGRRRVRIVKLIDFINTRDWSTALSSDCPALPSFSRLTAWSTDHVPLPSSLLDLLESLEHSL